MSETTDKLENARKQALAQYESIAEMIARYRAANDDDAYEDSARELAEAAGHTFSECESGWFYDSNNDDIYSTIEECAVACCDANDLRPDSDDARRTIEEDALSVQVRSGWYSPSETPEAEEFEILLCTGGPAVRIIGELGQFNEPDRARLQCQDWFTSWADVIDGVDDEVLLEYARCFYFGE